MRCPPRRGRSTPMLTRHALALPWVAACLAFLLEVRLPRASVVPCAWRAAAEPGGGAVCSTPGVPRTSGDLYTVTKT